MNPLKSRQSAPDSAPVSRPFLLFAAVLMVALLSFYVHLLDEQVERGQQFRAAQNGMAGKTVAQAGSALGASTMQPLRTASR